MVGNGMFNFLNVRLQQKNGKQITIWKSELDNSWRLISVKVTVDLQSAFRKMLCVRAVLKKTMVNYISLES